MTAQSGRKVRGCCCGIPIRVGVAILAWLYFLGGICAVYLAITVLQRATSLETGVKALVIALGSLSAFLVITSAFGIVATIGQYPLVARIWSIMFQIWYYLQLALDIAVIVLFFTKKLDSLVYDCANLSPNARPSSSASKNCYRARNQLGLYYTLSAVVRNAIGYFFTRRVSSYSRDCAERAAANNSSAVPTQMATIPGTGGAFPNSQGGYPVPYQTQADSPQGAKAV